MPFPVIIVVVQPLDLVDGLDKQGPQTVFFPEIQGHADRLHVHQVFDLLHPFVGHTGPLFDQSLIILDPGFPVVAPDHQIIVLSPFIGKLDIKSKVPVIHLAVIDLAHIIPPGRNVLERYQTAVLVLHLERRLGLRRLPDDPAV